MKYLEPTPGDAYNPAAMYYLMMLVFHTEAALGARAALFLMGRPELARAVIDPFMPPTYIGGNPIPFDPQGGR